MKWIACELHTHTVHSDGTFTVDTLTQRARELGLDAVVITDHNAISAFDEAKGKTYPCEIMRGLEWTTYFGHVLVLGAKHYVDWRDVTPDNIDEKIRAIKEADGLAGMAHPYAPGGAICCGCYWEFHLQDWNLLDYMEIWSGNTPQLIHCNVRARALWTRLLDQGYRITAVSARDWHGGESDVLPYGVSYLYIDEEKELTEAGKEALRKHRVYMTVGPEMTEFRAVQAERSAQMGESLPAGRMDIELKFEKGRRPHAWECFNLHPETVKLFHSGGLLAELPYKEDMRLTVKNAQPEKWCRAEVWGTMMDGKKCELLVSNPIFIENTQP